MKAYAPFFEWHEKGPKELGVVEELILALNQGGGLTLHSPREFNPDPPDCVCLDAAGKPVAIEVAEVVCETSARLTAQGRDVYRHWGPGELAEHISRELTDKDKKTYNGGPYEEIVICLFTDEPALTLDHAKTELSQHAFGPFAQLTSAYLLFSYDPGSQTYPVVRLSLRG